MGGREVFGVSCGDIMFDRLELFPDYEAAVAESGIPFFQVLGNHDVEVATRTDELSATVFRKRFGPTYYSFERGEIHYVVLDDVFWYGDYVGYIDQEQLDWLHADLSLVEPGRTVVVFAHIPVYCRFHERQGRPDAHAKAVVSNRDLLYAILEPYRSYILCGHMHETEFLEDGGSEIHVCGAACGAWWSGPICRDGTPKGYMVYEAAGGDLRWRYQSTGMPPRHQMRLYRPGAEKEAPELLIANVWGADDRWKIRWIEDGVPRGPMKRRRGLDPLSVNLHSGEDLPAKHGWVEPVMTDHLYAARPSPGAKEIFVEAEDPWGEVYREKLII